MSEESTKELTPEQREKLAAETEKLRDENRRAQEMHELTKAKVEAETKRMLAEAEQAAAEATIAVLRKNQVMRQEEAAMADDLFHCVYQFNKEVNDRSVDEAIARLSYWHRTRPNCQIEIVFSSPGGSVFAGMRLFDFIQELRRQGHYVISNTRGMAASMAGILLQSGDKRVMGKEAWVLIHEISVGVFGSFSQIEDEVELMKRLQNRVVDIFMAGVEKAKAAGTATKPISRRAFEANWRRKDWWVTSDQCLELGLVDEVR